jgi:hypothetical protein
MLEKLLSETGKVALAALLKATNTRTKVGYANALYDLLQRNGNIRDRVVIYILCTLAKRAREKRDAHERAEHNNTEMLKLAGQILMGEEEPIITIATPITTAMTAQNQAMNNALNQARNQQMQYNQMQYNQLYGQNKTNQLGSMSAYQGTSTCK